VSGQGDALAGVRAALAAAGRAGELGAWITPPDGPGVLEAASEVLRRGGPAAPLATRVLAVKDNIDVAGIPTTAGHPDFVRHPQRSAHVVQCLVDAGAVVAGKTNLDQFATGLVGTRSPFGICRNPHQPDRIAGGSSSGSAVAVATGAAELALATDTAGSGRVPAALCGLVGLKPTPGLLSVTGVVPAIAGLDCVSVLARSVALAAAALAAAATEDPDDPWSRPRPASTPAVGNGPLRVGVPSGRPAGLDRQASVAWAAAVAKLDSLGPVVEIDLGSYVQAGQLLYGGAFVAARWEAFGRFLAEHPEGADPTVAGLVAAGRDLPAAALVRDIGRLRVLAAKFGEVWSDVDVIAVPTVGTAPTIAEVAADPVAVNSELGVWTTGANLLDLCAAAVPCGWREDAVPFGLTFLGPAFADPLVAAAGARLLGEEDPPPPPWVGWSTIVVIGAHLNGQPLNGELTGRGGKLLRKVATAPSYRLFALPTDVPKPGMVRVVASGGAGAGSGAVGLGDGVAVGPGVSIEAELWVLPLAGFGDVVSRIQAPLSIGTVELSDGSCHPGFLCEPIAIAEALDISSYGGWVAYRHAASGAS
jgi:allophanate hydrolase